MNTPTEEEFRKAGWTDNARNFKRSERAYLLFCAFLNYPPEKAPATYRYAPNQSCLDAWERVAKL